MTTIGEKQRYNDVSERIRTIIIAGSPAAINRKAANSVIRLATSHSWEGRKTYVDSYSFRM